MSFTKQANQIFNRAINDYHLTDDVNTPIRNPYQKDSIEHSLYLKCWIDTVQWHYEDIIRDPHIDPVEALALKRRKCLSPVLVLLQCMLTGYENFSYNLSQTHL